MLRSVTGFLAVAPLLLTGSLVLAGPPTRLPTTSALRPSIVPARPAPAVSPSLPSAGRPSSQNRKPDGPASTLPLHHAWPRAMGSSLPYRSPGLSPISPPANHTAIHAAMRGHFRSQPQFWKSLPSGQRVNIYPRPGQQPSGSNIANFSVKERYKALDGFYRSYQSGKYLENFRTEAGLAARSKALK